MLCTHTQTGGQEWRHRCIWLPEWKQHTFCAYNIEQTDLSVLYCTVQYVQYVYSPLYTTYMYDLFSMHFTNTTTSQRQVTRRLYACNCHPPARVLFASVIGSNINIYGHKTVIRAAATYMYVDTTTNGNIENVRLMSAAAKKKDRQAVIKATN
jgi:hypothetical protein